MYRNSYHTMFNHKLKPLPSKKTSTIIKPVDVKPTENTKNTITKPTNKIIPRQKTRDQSTKRI